MTRRFWFVVAVAVQCAALYWPSTPSVDSGLPLDKAVHLVLFAAVAALGRLAGVPLGWLVCGLLVQALASELVQGTMPGRSADIRDLSADVAGIALGLFAAWAIQRRRAAPDRTGEDGTGPAHHRR